MIPDIRNYFGGNNKMVEGNSKIFKGLKKFLVTEVREKKNGFVNPVIVTFQNGELTSDTTGFKVSLTASKNGETRVEVKSPQDHVFKDSNRSERPRPCEYICIKNKKTNKVRLIQLDRASLIHSALVTDTTETNEYEKDYGKEIRTLNKTFGGKKIVSRLEQREKLNLSSLPIADEVKKAVEDIKVEENVSLNDTETESIVHLLPPCHRDATTVSDVYVINEILTDEELQALKEELHKLEETKFNPQEYSPFFMDCYTEAKKSEKDLEVRLASVLFVESLIKFLKMPSKKIGVKKAVLCSFSNVIHEKLLNEFCVKTDTSVTRPVTMRDKGLCYIIAVSLISCNYKINLKLLSASTSVHLSRLTRMAKAVGAVSLPKQENICMLKLPLPALPKATGGRNKRK